MFKQWIRKSVIFRKIFYKGLGTLFLREWYVKRAIRELPLGKKSEIVILDAGSGFGQYSYYCVQRLKKAHVLGLDIDPDHVADGNRFAQSLGLDRLEFREKDLATLAYQDRFELILSIDVLEHIQDDETLLYHLFQALKPGGHLIVSTPTAYRKHREDGEFVGEHFRVGYSEEMIIQKFGLVGFRLDRMIYSYGVWGDLAWRWGIRNTMRLMGHGFLGKGSAFFYLILLFPLIFSLMIIDYWWPNKRGTGIVIVASKP